MITRSLASLSRRPTWTRRFLLGFLLPVIGLLAPAAQAAPANYDIPAQPAPAALDLFIKQSGAQVVYLMADVKDARTNAVKGAYEPAAALEILLKDTGLGYTERKAGQFSVGRLAPQPGSIKGTLVGEGGRPMTEVLVSIRETAQSAGTDKYGQYVFPKMAAGTYVLVATSPGYQPLHIVDVAVKAGRDLTLGQEEMHKAPGDITTLEPMVVHADTVTELEKIEVTGRKGRPFEGANLDIPRTINDAQPYYIFDAKTIDESGAVNTEDFLKQRLTMNATALTNSQQVQTSGNTSTINLRALGSDRTLVLINGRRLAGVTRVGGDSQTDLNGIPLSAIDRIEVLPSSASGIYGGSAIGGVVNVILKKDYTGGELRLTYDNTWDSDSPTKTVALNYGLALEGGRTHVTLNGSWSESSPLLLQDRREVYEQYLGQLLKNNPTFYFGSTSAILGALPNIVPSSSAQTTLTLKNGAVINSRQTHLSPGISPTTSLADVSASLVANGGTFSTDLPPSTQAPSGLLRPFGSAQTVKTFSAGVSRQMFSRLEAFVDFSYNQNRSRSVTSPFTAAFTVPLAAPNNPFTTAVSVRIPDAATLPLKTGSLNRGVTAGLVATLPGDWRVAADYAWSQNRFDYFLYNGTDTTAITADLLTGALNPLVDTLKYPLNLAKYAVANAFTGTSELHDVNLRGSGPLPSLPWGRPTLTVGLEYRLSHVPSAVLESVTPVTTANSFRRTYFARDAETKAGYLEATVPVVKPDWLPGVHALDLQLSGRSERYQVDAGATNAQYFYNRTPPTTTYDLTDASGQPYFTEATYTATNYTVGFKYEPVKDVIVRASRATAFLPPTPGQLTKNPVPFTGLTVNDPITGQKNVSVSGVSGGNPNLIPQSSKSLNAGVVWEPQAKRLKGLRLDVEYYEIEQFNAFGTLLAQQIVDQEKSFPGRVTRDSNGNITLVDISSMNLFSKKTAGWDLSADYTFATGLGRFTLRGTESILRHLKEQISATLPETEAAGYSPSENGAPKYKSSLGLTWQQRGWTAGWATRTFSAYKAYGAAGGPNSVSSFNGANNPTTIANQGGDTIPAQVYHDLFASYAFGRQPAGGATKLQAIKGHVLDGLSVQLGVRNVFNKVPPYDARQDLYYLISPYGDMRLRSYWLSVKKEF